MSKAQFAKRPIESCSCDSILARAIDFNFGEGYGETWDVILPDNLTPAQCHKILENQGYDEKFERNPFKMSREELIEILSDDDVSNLSNQELLELVIEEIDDGTIDEWMDAVLEVIHSDQLFVPMMNYLWPLPEYDRYDNTPGEDQWRLYEHGGSVCLVTVNDTTYIALTGGGMDLSSHIIEAYLLLGYSPPLDLITGKSDLFYDVSDIDTRSWLVAGALRSCEVVKLWATRAEERLHNLL
jgi:hypothetical protein